MSQRFSTKSAPASHRLLARSPTKLEGRETMLRIQAELYQVWARIRDRIEREEGQALVEYALILALIAVLTVAALQAIGANVSGLLDKLSTSLSSVTNP